MEILTLLQQIFTVCLFPCGVVLIIQIGTLLQAKVTEISESISNKQTQKYLKLLHDIIDTCVVATNQTYVNALKAQNLFDKTAQEKAFSITCNAVLALLSDEATECLTNLIGDINIYIKTQIENSVSYNKK